MLKFKQFTGKEGNILSEEAFLFEDNKEGKNLHLE